MTRKKYYVASIFLAAVSCQAASTATLKVAGKVTPPACNLTLVGGGLVDFQTLSMATLHTYTKRNGVAFVVPPKTVLLTVSCPVATAIALNLVDNEANSKAPIDTNDAYYYGLGLTGTKQVGAYSVGFAGLMIDIGVAPKLPGGYLTRPATETVGTWDPATAVADRTLFNPANSLGFRSSGLESTPVAVRSVAGNLSITPLLLISTAEDSLVTYDLAGSATISLLYL